MAYKQNETCVVCGTIVQEAYVNIGYGSYYKRYVCPKCHPVMEIKSNCRLCKKPITYLVDGEHVINTCPKCQDKLIKASEKKACPSVQRIPSWRLKIDDASPDEVTSLGSQAFGMPTKSKGEWDEYYKQPHEVEKQKQFQKDKEKQRRELYE